MVQLSTAGEEATTTADELARAAVSLATRFANGSTMWCVAPSWPAHGQHVAVEFVHPVIMGKRALPAVQLDALGATASLRLLARPRDVLLVLAPSSSPEARRLLQRAEAWGLTRLWLGAGTPPEARCAEHLIWIDADDEAVAARDGDIVLLYHLLWELTQVVFEHPGLLGEEEACGDQRCITCSDDASVAEVRTRLDAQRAEVVCRGQLETIDVSLVEHAEPGSLVLVHAGVALADLDEVADEPRAGHAAGAHGQRRSEVTR